jgi:muramoyltetrapeptide carboxypeptidase
MIFPQFINDKATIGIVAPAGKVEAEVLHFTEKFLHSLGHKVVLGDQVFNSFHQFAGNDEHRTMDLQHMLDRKDIDIIMCARGGYGTNRIIHQLDFSQFMTAPKWIIGYSDITILHACLQGRLGIASIHGPMPKNFPDKSPNDSDLLNLFNILKGELPTYTIDSFPLNKTGETDGVLIGGNLSILYSMRGTNLDFDPHGKILFIEDLGEYLYHLDRMMVNFKNGGILKNIRGLVVGQFTDMKDSDTPFGQTAYEIILNTVKEYDYPVVFNFPSGHEATNQPLVFGKRVQLSVTNAQSQLIF